MTIQHPGYPLHQSSPKLLERIAADKAWFAMISANLPGNLTKTGEQKRKPGRPPKEIGRPSRYPLKEMEVGQSFALPTADIKEQALRTMIDTLNAYTDRRFMFIEHLELDLYEVARVQ